MSTINTQNKILINIVQVVAVIACLTIVTFLWNITPKGLEIVVVDSRQPAGGMNTVTNNCPPFIMPRTEPPPPLPTPKEEDVADKTKLTAILIDYVNTLNVHYRNNNKLINDAYRTYNECLLKSQLDKTTPSK